MANLPADEQACAVGVHVHPCSALVEGRCRNGFPVRRGCMPAHVVGPNGFERWHAITPPCCDEEFPFTRGDKHG